MFIFLLAMAVYSYTHGLEVDRLRLACDLRPLSAATDGLGARSNMTYTGDGIVGCSVLDVSRSKSRVTLRISPLFRYLIHFQIMAKPGGRAKTTPIIAIVASSEIPMKLDDGGASCRT
ncbi:hypothetical protein F4859DRAFT_36992 [Xylaria cf. heliscus]|nr:hypothetical protein F4859DRAFT_36992 [Xylaria cf. heliscus]